MPKIINGVVIHEPEVCDVMLRFIRPGQCAIDCGANDGYFTGFMSHLVGPDGIIVAFEPDTVLFERLKQNTVELTNVTARRNALWSVDCPMEFFRASESGYSSFLKYDDILAESYMLAARSLDTLLLQPQPSFIKVDCEGADEHVLRGAEQILRRGVDCVTAEINFYINHKFGSSDRSLRNYMNALGYDCFLLEDGRKPLYIRFEDTINLTGRGLSLINAMFAKRSRVEEIWQYDCVEYVQQRLTVDSMIAVQSRSGETGLLSK